MATSTIQSTKKCTNTNLNRKIIVLEFNELSPTLMDQFINEGKLPNFKKLRDRSDAYVTLAEEKQEHLEPWIQWPTIHTGLSFNQHQLYLIGEGHKLDKPRIWDLVSKAGHKSIIFGSMNTGPAPQLDGVLVPDPWTTTFAPSLPEIQDYTNFIGYQVQEHTNSTRKLDYKIVLRFIKFMITHGLSLKTISLVVKQLISEKFAPTTWKRVAILDSFQLDVFRHYYKKIQPQFATFFLNSTAHLQHMFWRNMDPSAFEVKPTVEEQNIYKNAVQFGYQNMDNIVGKVLEMAGDDVTLVMTSALSQQPCTRYEHIGGKRFCRPIELAKILEFAGVKAPFKTAPVMSEQFYVHFNSEKEALKAENILKRLYAGSRPILGIVNKGKSLFLGCTIFEKMNSQSTIDLLGESNKVLKQSLFFDFFYQVEDKKSGMHHPDGILWISRLDQKSQVYTEKLPLTAVAPTLLQLLGIRKPEEMIGQPIGANLQDNLAQTFENQYVI
jgi:hypothetical protein